MWRKFFGPATRIIGVDLNPVARKWEADGFEIYIGDQSDEAFWERFFSTVGDVDIIIDDGGHTNEQQMVTAISCIPRIKDSGMLIVEDTHTSYMESFGNPSRYSFISYAKYLLDAVNSRCPMVHASSNRLNKIIYSISFYESIICFRVDRGRCCDSVPTVNRDISDEVEDFRNKGTLVEKVSSFQAGLKARFRFLRRVPLARRIARAGFAAFYFAHLCARSIRRRKYFSE